MSNTVSWVVNLRPHSGQVRLRLMAAPSSVDRLSMTLVSGWRQKGQCICSTSPRLALHRMLAHAPRQPTAR
jgi:hypothetical protein